MHLRKNNHSTPFVYSSAEKSQVVAGKYHPNSPKPPISSFYPAEISNSKLKSFRIEDKQPHPYLNPDSFDALALRNGDQSLQVPKSLPAKMSRSKQARFAESSVYPYLETNVADGPMSFSQEPIEGSRSQLSISKHGANTPFRHHSVMQKYVESLVHRNGYEKLVSYDTCVELAEKVGNEWRLVLRRNGDADAEDEWWEERFDAVVVASGHFNVPYIPQIPGLADLERARPGSVKHTKMFRGRDSYCNKVSLSRA